MQCAVVLRVDVTIEPKLLENLLILSSQIYIYMNIYLHEYKRKFSEHNKI